MATGKVWENFAFRRQNRLYKPLKSVKQCDALDSETTPDGYARVIADSTQAIEIKNIQEALDFICHERHHRKFILAWNIAFDVNAIFKHDRELTYGINKNYKFGWGDYEFSYIPRKCMKIRHGGMSFTIYDISQFYNKMSLAKASALFLSKQEHALKSQRANLFADFPIEQIKAYCLDDAQSTAQLGKLFVNSLVRGGLNPKHLYSTGYVSQEFCLRSANLPTMYDLPWVVSRMYWKAYRGGWFDMYKRGRMSITSVDISCLDAETLVEGKPIREIEVGNLVNGQCVTAKRDSIASTSWKFTLESGHEIICTPTHRFPGMRKKVRPASTFSVGELMSVSDWKDTESTDEDVFAGITCAEGGFVINKPVRYLDKSRNKMHNTRHYRWQITIDDRELELRAWVEKYLTNLGYHYDIYRKLQTHGISIRCARKAQVLELLRRYQESCGSNDFLRCRSFLKGFFESDGTVNELRREVDAIQNKPEQRELVLMKLGLLGFHPYLYDVKPHVPIAKSGYVAHAFHITLRSSEVSRYMREIGFVTRRMRCRVMSKIVSIDKNVGARRVIDLTLDGDHLYYANGIKTHNSAYPAATWELPDIRQGNWVKGVREDSNIGVVDATVMNKLGECQPLAFKFKNTTMNIYPLIDEPTPIHLTLGEYKAYRDEMEIHVRRAWSFVPNEKLDYPYRSIIKTLFEQKKAAAKGSVDYMRPKIIMNSLYGKTCEAVKREDGRYRIGQLFNPCYAAEITARTRIAIFNAIKRYRKDVVCILTDAIMFDKNIQLKPYPSGIPDDGRPEGLGSFEPKHTDADCLMLQTGVYQFSDGEAATRGFSAKNNLWERCREATEFPIVHVKSKKAFGAKECIIQHRFEDIATFTDCEKDIYLSRDRKRIWGQLNSASELLDISQQSYPITKGFMEILNGMQVSCGSS